MGVTTDVVVFVAGGADAVNSLTQGSAGGGPAGAAGQIISTAGAAAQPIGTIVSATPIAGVIGNSMGAVGGALTAVQITIDLNDGQSIKAGDALSVGFGIPVAIAAATGTLAAGSILIPIAALVAISAAVMNLRGLTLDDLFRLLDKIADNRDLPYDRQAVEQALNFALPVTGDAYRDEIPGFVNMCYRDARRWQPPRDPLVLDLDSDGIEAVGISDTTPILFDHDADGTRTGTGWIKPDDGLLVLDRNGNGTIDSGRELFGDETLLPNGDKAANGYAALAQYDANGDGKISSADAVYADLRVWQDANQDGISQASELRTLADLGIASLGVQGTAANVNLGNGNTMPLSGSFTRTDGSAGTSGVAELSGSLLLANNGFYREFTDDPIPTEAAKALPQMRGSGWVRDLREAMSDPGGAGAALQSQVQAFAAAKTRDAQLALLDGLLAEWAKSSGKKLDAIWTYELVQDAAGHYTTGLQRTELALPVFLTLNPDGMVRTLGGTGTGGGGRPSLATGAARRRRCGHRSPTSMGHRAGQRSGLRRRDAGEQNIGFLIPG